MPATLKKIALAAAGVIAAASLTLPALPAQALWKGHYEALKDTRTCITMWDHIDGNGRAADSVPRPAGPVWPQVQLRGPQPKPLSHPVMGATRGPLAAPMSAA